MSIFDLPTRRCPRDVNDENWDELKGDGFEFETNLGWPLDEWDRRECDQTDEEFVSSLRETYGPKNVMLGLPMNHADRPDADFFPDDGMCGVYVRRAQTTQPHE